MNKFFELDRIFHKGDIYIESSEVPEYIQENYSDGISLAPIKGTLKFFYKYKTNRKPDYLSGTEGYPIVSTRFKDILTDISPGFLEFFPVQLICEKTKEIDTSYFFVNILNNIPCLDWAQSKYEKFGLADVVINVSKLVIKPDVIRDRNIFRIAELPVLIFVSDKLKSILEKEAISGVEIINIEDVTLG